MNQNNSQDKNTKPQQNSFLYQFLDAYVPFFELFTKPFIGNSKPSIFDQYQRVKENEITFKAKFLEEKERYNANIKKTSKEIEKINRDNKLKLINSLNKLNQELEKKLLDQENQIKKDQNDLNNLHKNISFLELRQVDKKKELQVLIKEGFNQEENIKLIQKLEEEFISNNNLIKDYQNCIKSKKIADVTFLQLLEEIRKNLPEDNKDIVNFNLNILRSTQKSEEKLITKIHTLTK